MPYVSIGQIAGALESLQRFHVFFGVTFLSMKKEGVTTSKPKLWGSEQENALLASAYTPPGAPSGKKFFLPFGRPEAETGFWRNPKYSGGSLQSARTREKFKEALEHPSRAEWAFSPGYVATLESLLPKVGTTAQRLPVFDLAAWIYRDEILPPALADVEAKFRSDFGLNDPVEYAKLFDATQPNAAQFFSPDPVDRGELINLIKGVPEGPSLNGRSEADLISHLETSITNDAALTLPPGFVRTFYTALKAQRIVILAGRPGTGKTAFVKAYFNAISSFFDGCAQFVEISVSQEFSEADVIGYEKISGGLAATELSRRMFLSGRPNDVYIVLLDEMNLAHVDHYLARLLPAFESDSPVELPGTGSTNALPSDAMLIGTVNSYLEESTRLPLSGPLKRRANVMEMPNFLESLVVNGRRAEFEQACIGLLKQSKDRVSKRQRDGSASVLDGFRGQHLGDALLASSRIRSSALMDPLWSICGVCCSDTATALTFGVVQDILDYISMSPADVPHALSDQIAQKIVPQLNGPAKVAKAMLALVDGLDVGSGHYATAKSALEALIRTEDVGSGYVTYRY